MYVHGRRWNNLLSEIINFNNNMEYPQHNNHKSRSALNIYGINCVFFRKNLKKVMPHIVLVRA